MFDRGSVPYLELWRGRRMIRLGGDYAFPLILLPLAGAALALYGLRRVLATPGTLEIAVGILFGAGVGLLLFGQMVRSSYALLRNAKVLRRFDGLALGRIKLRCASPEDRSAVADVYDQVTLQANGIPAASLKHIRMAFELDYWWGPSQTLTVTDRDNGEILGFAFLNGIQKDGVPEAGLSLAQKARGKGLAVEVVLALGQVVANAGFDRVRMGTRQQNTAMRRSLERAGASPVREGPHKLPNGEEINSVWYELKVTPGATNVSRTDQPPPGGSEAGS